MQSSRIFAEKIDKKYICKKTTSKEGSHEEYYYVYFLSISIMIFFFFNELYNRQTKIITDFSIYKHPLSFYMSKNKMAMISDGTNLHDPLEQSPKKKGLFTVTTKPHVVFCEFKMVLRRAPMGLTLVSHL